MQAEHELDVILDNCLKIKWLYLDNEDGNFVLENIDFLKDRDSLEIITLKYATGIDYSVLSSCNNIVSLYLAYSDFNDFEMLTEFESLSKVYIYGAQISTAR